MEQPAGIRESKDMSLDLFMGISQNPKYYDEEDANRNAKIMGLFSKEIRKSNKHFFREKLDNNISADLRHFIQEINDSDEPYYDTFGRATYFTTSIGGKKLPIYQPGSIMWETAVQRDCDIAVMIGDK